jgi:predicted dehydrogenase
MSSIHVPRVAIIGCGAIARLFHAPALKRHRDIARAALFVDPDLRRAQSLAAETGGGTAAANVADVIGNADGAIVCVPHHLHVDVCRQLLRAGIHVLCEKPLAERPDDVRALVALAASSGVALAVNNMRRSYPSMREIARLVHSGELGGVRNVLIRWGERFDWDAASGFYFGAQARNRGALLDRGAHVLDLVCWWLGGQPQVVRYLDDSEGGSEAVADLLFRHGGSTGRVQLSWLTKYENTIEVSTDRADVKCGIYDWTRFTITEGRKAPRTVQLPAPAATPREISNIMVDNFIDVVRGVAAPLVPGTAVVDSIALIANAYAAREPLPQPWHEVYRRVIDV